MATADDYRIVEFDRYCSICKHYEKSGYDSPCEECQDSPFNLYSARPINWACIKLTADQAYDLLKKELVGHENVYSNYVIDLIGEDCFKDLINKGYLKLVDIINKREKYALADERKK